MGREKTVFILLLIIQLFAVGCQNKRDDATIVINTIEVFYKTNHRYPLSLFEIGFQYDEGGPIYYTLGETKKFYGVYYLTGFDSYQHYDSRTKKWAERI